MAKARLAQILEGGVTVEASGRRDIYGRELVRLRLADGRTAGAVLIAEGLAAPWKPGDRNDWCGD